MGEDAMMNAGGVINERILVKLSVQPPSAMLVQAYLQKIAEEFEVDWQPQQQLTTDQLSAPMGAPIGYSVSVASGSGLGTQSYQNGGSDDSSTLASTMPPPYNGPGGGDGGGGLPVVMGVPPLPTAPSTRFGNNKTNDPSDIPPPAPGSSTASTTTYHTNATNNNNDTLSTKSSQYDDIEARFQKLNNKK